MIEETASQPVRGWLSRFPVGPEPGVAAEISHFRRASCASDGQAFFVFAERNDHNDEPGTDGDGGYT